MSKAYTAPLKPAPKLQNVQFSFVASERQIKVNLEELPVKMEGCTIDITVKEVMDKNGNIALPVTWSANVQQNNLYWNDNEISVEKNSAESSSFTASIENRGAETEMWNLTGLPSWLKASVENGSLKPLSSGLLTFTVDQSLPIGNYEATVYLTGAQNISAPLTLHVKVKGELPKWSVNAGDFENSMNVIGRVNLEGVPMSNPDNLVAAFVGEECRGVAHPEYKSRYDGYFVTMNIYGNETDKNNEVTFRAYDASTGTLYPVLEPDREITYIPLSLIGKYDAPVVFTVLDKIEQSTDLKTGWNWISLNVKADNMMAESVFEKIADDVSIVKSQHDGWLMYENGKWGGNMQAPLGNEQMYAVKLLHDRNLRVVGKRVDPDECQITVSKGWNWIGYYGRQNTSLDNALAGVDPQDGDIFKSQSGVAYFDDYEWAGSISMLQPGVGYMLNSTTDADRTFGYGSNVTFAGARRFAPSTSVQQTGSYTPVDYHNYSGNAIMTAMVMAAGKPLAHADLGVFANGECRAAATTNSDGVAYLTIPGDDNVTLSFKVTVNGKETEAEETLNYVNDAAYGSPQHPYVIKLNDVTGIREIGADDESATVYDLKGRKVSEDPSRLSRGVYIMNGKKKAVK
jgi:hypothetical protein